MLLGFLIGVVVTALVCGGLFLRFLDKINPFG